MNQSEINQYALFGISQEISALLKWIEIHFDISKIYFSVTSRFIRKVIVKPTFMKDVNF